MDRVAEPLPALASTTTVPAFWIFSVMGLSSAAEKVTGGVVWWQAGRQAGREAGRGQREPPGGAEHHHHYMPSFFPLRCRWAG